MDHTEDLSARVLLKNILSTEPPKTPIARSLKGHTSGIRRSNRLSTKVVGAQTPQDILRRSIKHKIRESITRKSLPTTKRATSAVLRKAVTPAPTSVLFDDDDTPRHILRNILRTDPVQSPVVHGKAASEEPKLPSANSSITSKRPSIELSGLDLPDLTIGNIVSTAKGLSRKRPRRSFNVTAFEKRLKEGDVAEETELSSGDYSSVSSSSSTSLSLKTPYMDVHTEKRGLQRKVSNRRKITEEEFGAAVNRQTMEGVSSFAPKEGGRSETFVEGFTLNLSEPAEPDITSDIVNCNTALYTQPDAMTSNIFNVATQDKPTVVASQLQAQLEDRTQIEAEQSQSMYVFPTEKEPQHEECVSAQHSENSVDAAKCQTEECKSTIDHLQSQKLKTGEEGTLDHLPTFSKGEEGVGIDSLPEEDVGAELQSNVGGFETGSQTEVEDEDGVVYSQYEQDADVRSQSEEEEIGEEDQSEQEDPAVRPLSEEDGDVAESQTKDRHDGTQDVEMSESESVQPEYDVEQIIRRVHRSEGRLIKAVTEAESGCSEGRSKAHGAADQSNLESRGHESSQPYLEMLDLGEPFIKEQEDISCTEVNPDAYKENACHHVGMTDDRENSHHMGKTSPEPAEQEEELEDEIDESPGKIPAFVREKMNFFPPDQQPSPSVLGNIHTSNTSEALPETKPKKVHRKRTVAKKEAGLPKSYLVGVFKHFAKTKVSADVYPVLKEIMDKFFDRLADDLETYAVHAKRKTIDVEDAELLLKRQGYVNDKVPVEVLIEKYLRMDQRKLLIPIATSGNIVIPKKRR
ncbi:centromere protein T isoform X2 [Echeneis naucrates]|uniref:centromere protein T isoform X2 n=1 Tax=Echeneis naucrates TaxID=173247 RepID=UPI0011137F4B|nr:centromere protein T isoform X2 [Echeneis naucrates]